MTALSISHATHDDARAVAEIHVDAWRAAYADILPGDYLAALSVTKREAMWRREIAAASSPLIVARRGGVLRGWLSFGLCRDEDASPACAEIYAVYVAPADWSGGIGRQLWAHASDMMTAQGFTTCCLWVLPQNARAIRFYRAAGFSPSGRAEKTFDCAGTQVAEQQFVVRLSSRAPCQTFDGIGR